MISSRASGLRYIRCTICKPCSMRTHRLLYSSTHQVSSWILVLTRARIFKLSRIPGIDSDRLCSLLAGRARICRSFKETRYRFSGWRAGTKPYLSYRLHRLVKSIPGLHKCLQIRAQVRQPFPARFLAPIDCSACTVLCVGLFKTTFYPPAIRNCRLFSIFELVIDKD
jgi:hypothetical protein